jgi:uncharacterized integral membrane protein (TIGR00698 family)
MLDRPQIPGFLASVVLGAVALGVGEVLPRVGSATAALAIGILAGFVLRRDERTLPGIRWTAKQVLALTIVVLGSTLDVFTLTQLGMSSLGVVVGVVATTVGLAVLLGRMLGLPPGVALLVGIGTGICGTSAVAATAPLVQDEPGDAGVAIGVLHALGLVGLVVLPALVGLLELPPPHAGLVIGGTLAAVGHVVAAAFTLGETTGDIALAVKMGRVALLVPLVLGLAVWRSRPGRPPLSWEVAGFVVAAAVAATGLLPAALLGVLDRSADVLLAVAMAAIGATIDPRQLLGSVPRALVLGGLLMAVQVALLLAFTLR